MEPPVDDLLDEAEISRLLRQREIALNEQLGAMMFWTGIAYGLCLVCCLTGVFLTGRTLGVLGFLPGMICLLTGAAIAFRHRRDPVAPPWLKHVLFSLSALAILDVSLIQLVWGAPCLVGFVMMIYTYRNTRLTLIYYCVILAGVFVAAAANAFWGMPNPDMLPYPDSISAIPDGYVTLWAMNHPESWNRFEYFLRVLRFHSLPLIFLLLIVTGSGYAMGKRMNRQILLSLARARRIREIETCLLLTVGGGQPLEVLLSVLGEKATETMTAMPLSKAFLDSIPAARIPALMKAFRQRCAADSAFAEHAATEPESALKEVLADVMA